MSIARFAVTRRVSVAMLATAIVVLGIFALPRLPIALLPSFQPPVVSVTVNYGNTSPETMESSVTRPIENAVSRVAGIDYLQSDSFQGQSQIRAQFKYGTNIDIAAVQIQQQIARIQTQLPNDPNLSQPQIVKADPNALPVVGVYVSDTMRTTRDLSDLYTNYLTDEFSAISGVGSAGVSGTAQRAIMVEPNENLLAGYGLDTSAITSKISKENQDLPAGIIQVGNSEYGIRANGLYQNPQQIADTVIAIRNGSPIYIRDVAKVRDSVEEVRIFGRLNGQPAIRLFITAQPDANVVAVANGVYAKIAELQKRYPTMHFGVVIDQRGFIQEAITALEHTAILGACLAILIILLFLHSWRSTLIVSISLPVSVLGTLFACYIFNLSLNTMTMGGLALAVGLIVDDAVVVIENIFRHFDHGEGPTEAAQNATAQIFTAVLASSVTVVTVFVPLLLIPGLQGLIFGPMALVIMTGVAISFLVAVTTVPMLSATFLHADQHAPDENAGWYGRFSAGFDRLYDRFADRYRGLLSWSVDHPAPILGGAVVVFILTLLALKAGFVQTETFPASDSRFARFDIRLPNGTALNVTNNTAKLVEAAFMRDPRVEDVGSAVGSSFGGGTSRSITNQMSLSITLKPQYSGTAAGVFVQDWQMRLGGTPARRGPGGSSGASSTAPRQNFNALPPAERARRIALRRALVGSQVRGRTIDIVQQQVSQGSDALQIQLYGPDNNTLYKLATGLEPYLGTIPGVIRPDTNIPAPQPELEVNIDRRRAAQLGFSTGDIGNDISTATSGTVASYYQVNGIQYPILVELPASQRRSMASIADLQLTPPTSSTTILNSAATTTPTSATMPGTTSSSFGSVPLSAVADIHFGVGPAQISRQNKQRRIDINAPVIGQPLGMVIAQAQQVMNNYRLPQGYRWQFGPSITQNNNTFSALGIVVVLAIALIYMLLASQFESFIDPLVIMMSVPLASTGIVLSLMITHRAFGLTAFIGSLMLVGIAVKNAILVIEFTKQLRRDGMTAREALLHAGPMRLRPIMMTTLATMGGMLPLALAIEAGSSTNAPLGTVVIGGLITSTILSLLVVPTLYLWSTKHVERRFGAKPPKIGRRPAPEQAARDAAAPPRDQIPATLKTNPQST